MTETTTTRREKRVTYYQPGLFLSEETTRPIQDGPDLPFSAQPPTRRPGTFCFMLTTVITAPPVPDGEGGTLKVLPKTVEKTGPATTSPAGCSTKTACARSAATPASCRTWTASGRR